MDEREAVGGGMKCDKRDPEMCIHALSVNDDMDLLCLKGQRRVMCNGPCADFVDCHQTTD